MDTMTGLLKHVDGLQRAGSTSGGEYAGPCPWCGGEDRFRVWPEHPSGTGRWWCRRCDRRGDEIGLLRERYGMTYLQAAAASGKAILNHPGRPPSRPYRTTLPAPNPGWQTRAEEVAQETQEAMWTNEGDCALTYLCRRGLREETVRDARLGYNASDRYESPAAWGLPSSRPLVWVPRGIVFPWRISGAIWRLNVRRQTDDPKYIGPAGSSNGLYGSDGIWPNRPVVVVEGEMDALAVAQVAGDLAVAVATGSTSGARKSRWVTRLASAQRIILAFDDDGAGEQASAWWRKALPQAQRWTPNDDPATMLERGEDLRSWVENGIEASG